MNLDLDDPKLHQELREWYRSIACFVHGREIFWVIDDRNNFTLDAEIDFDIYRKKDHMPDQQISTIRNRYRGGISQLTCDNFEQYLALPHTHVVPTEQMRAFFFDRELGDFDVMQDQLERHLAFGDEFDQDRLMMRRKLASRLPTFYINFDRNIYLHMDWGRFHETYAYDGWYAREEDFGHNIPVAERYWWSAKADFWPVRFFTD